MRAVRASWPVGLAVEAVPECQVRVQPGTVGVHVGRAEMEGVVHVVQAAYFQVAVDLVELPGVQQQVDDGSSYPLDTQVDAAAGQGLPDHAEQVSAGGQP